MPITDNGKGNIVEGEVSDRLDVKFNADDCRLILPNSNRIEGSIEFYRPNQTVQIGEGTTGKVMIYMKGAGNIITIGERTKINNVLWANLAETGCEVTIGNDCLIGSAKFRPSDSHKIFDTNTGERINTPKPIIVGDHVWLSEEINILKGAQIGSGSVVGSRAVVSNAFLPNSLLAGVPARAIRDNIRWEE
ncbi:MAG: acyltransferase [Asticcacaulis sp.]|nr:acyltransferase [Asticcacaulis sp.]